VRFALERLVFRFEKTLREGIKNIWFKWRAIWCFNSARGKFTFER